MKNITLAVFTILAVASCKKSVERPAEFVPVKFYSSNTLAAVKLLVVTVNGQNAGQLKYGAYTPTCETAGYSATQLQPGTYVARWQSADNAAQYKDATITVVAGTGCQFFNLQ